MSSRQRSLCAASALFLAAAATPLSPAWTAKLLPSGGSTVSGSASVDATGSDSSRASISITGAKAGEYPWHVHTGRCGTEGPPVGSAASYPVLKVSADGKASAAVTIPFKPAPGTDYSVNVHRSTSDETVIACGGLRPSGQMTTDSLRATPMPHDTTNPTLYPSPADSGAKKIPGDTTAKKPY